MKLNFITDNVADGTSGWVVDKLEYTTTANGRYVMHLRGASSIADDDAKARFEENIAHRREDGRSLTANGSLFDGSRVYSPSRNPDGNRCLESRVRDLDHQAPGDDEECVSGGVLPNRPSEAPVPVDVVVPPNYYVLCDEGMTSSCGEDVVPATGFVLSLCNSPVPELRAAGFELARQVCAPNYNRILQASADSRWVDPQITAFCPSPTDPGSIVCVTCCRGLAVCNYSGPARPGAPKMMMCINNN